MTNQPALKRTTIFLPTNMMLNLQVLALQKGESQSTVIRSALAAYIKKSGYDPHKKPRIKVTHR